MTCNIGRRLAVLLLVVVFTICFLSTLPIEPTKAELSSMVTTSLSLSATINGHSFTVTGTGAAYPYLGQMVTTMTFSSSPEDYHPLCYGKTWKCKRCHKAFALELDGGMNLYTLTQGNFDTHMTKTYSHGAEGTLTISAQIRMTSATHSHTDAQITGYYTGPIDAVDVLASHPTLYPAGPGEIIAEDVETVVMSDDDTIQISTYEEISFVDTTAEMPFRQEMSITPITLSWTPETLTFEEETIVSIRPVPDGGIAVPVDKLSLLAPYIGLTSTIVVATAATAICIKRVKHGKEK